MKAFKKFVCILFALIFIIVSVIPAFAVDITELTFLYIDKGDIVIGDGTVSGYGLFGQKITQPSSVGYCITSSANTSSQYTVTVDGGENYIVLKNVNIQIGSDFTCAFYIQNGANVDLFFTGINTLRSGSARAGLEVSPDSQVIINGDGTLNAMSGGQAGIGGGNGRSNGTVIINSGTITATCGSESAGIGGGSSGDGGNIIINGGNVTANGGSYAAGIGGGSARGGGNVTINGGTVTSTGGMYGAGIGGGWYGQMGNIVINGGTVKAVGGESAPAIGAGKGLQTVGTPVNSDGNTVYLAKINSASLGTVNTITVNGRDYSVCGTHPNDTYYYIYIPSGTNFISFENSTSSQSIYRVNLTSSGSASGGKINPVQAINGAEIGNDDIIRGISCGLTNLNNYLSVDTGYSLSYDNEFMGTGTHVTVMYGDIPVCTYRTLLYGDVNNDGFFDGEDSVIVFAILWDMLTRNNTDAIVFEAADANRNGYIDANDMYLLEDAGLLLSSVSQTVGEDGLVSDSLIEYVMMLDQTPAVSQTEQEGVTEEITVENKTSVIDFIFTFIKYVIKIFTSVHSFWKIF